MRTKERDTNLSVQRARKEKKKGMEFNLPKIQINKPTVDWQSIWESDQVRKRGSSDLISRTLKRG